MTPTPKPSPRQLAERIADDDSRHTQLVKTFLRKRGWKLYAGGPLWFKPMPGWKGKPCIVGQPLFCLAEAYDAERRQSAIVG